MISHVGHGPPDVESRMSSATAANGGETDLPGEVDFIMMYVAHDAFNRDLRSNRLAGEG